MDFWSRLIAGTSFAPVDKTSSRNPETRLALFKKEYHKLLSQTDQSTTGISRDYEAIETIRSSLQELTAILSDESRRPLPHSCVSYACSKKIYTKIEKIVRQSRNEGIIREGVAIFATLIESEEEDFVKNHAFSKSLMRLLVHITKAKDLRIGLDTEIELVELSFNITTKIRLDPDILPAWFSAQTRVEDKEQEMNPAERFTGKTNRKDFPLFYLLIDYIHHDGRIGDFARTGLLYIIEAASNSDALEQWIVESDLATLMATGLGALYSQLSRKLVIDYPDDELAPVLALSDYEHPFNNLEIVSSSSTEFQLQMETFLSHLVFWQDVLNHCKSTEVKQTLLEHFKVIFLEQLLYPSLLESSDLDGGSSVAVLTYLRRILEVLDHPDMIHLILHYLLALPDPTPCSSSALPSVSAARQRKSLDLATMLASQIESKSTPALYNLVDLVYGSLRSQSNQTVSVTLQLISVILKRHHRYAITTLLRTSFIFPGRALRTIGAHNSIMYFLLELVGEIGGDNDFLDDTYSKHITDCRNILECHSCSIGMLSPQSTAGVSQRFTSSYAAIPGAPRDVRSHTLRIDDPLLQIIVEMLDTFLTNPVEINLSLTATVTDLATCGYMRIDGWLLPDPLKYSYDKDESEPESLPKSEFIDPVKAEEESQIASLRLARRAPIIEESKCPALLNQLKKIIKQVSIYKTEIPRFDELLKQRREAFLTASFTISAPTPARQQQTQTSFDSISESSTRLNAFDTLTQRIFPERSTSRRSKSPRGNKSQDRSNKQAVGARSTNSSAFRSVSTPSRSTVNYKAPFIEDTRDHSLSYVEKVENSSRRTGLPINQAVEFAAEDQSIMARKIGAPNINRNLKIKTLQSFREEKEKDGSEKVKTSKNTSPVDANGPKEDIVNQKFVSVNHLLTNVIVMQEFLLELAALIQVRASLFGEVCYA